MRAQMREFFGRARDFSGDRLHALFFGRIGAYPRDCLVARAKPAFTASTRLNP
jgi:hypothetical protein